MNGIAVLHSYFRIFTGTRATAQISLQARVPERIAKLLITSLIIGGGVVPGPSISSRYHAAIELGTHREIAKKVGSPSLPKPPAETQGASGN
jgi:NADH-quinone oxidoreductase subunit M